MPLFLGKNLVKWSTLAFLGVGAYFLGYFWGTKHIENAEDSRMVASSPDQERSPKEIKSDQAADLRKLK